MKHGTQFLSSTTGYAVGESESWNDGWEDINRIYFLRTSDGGRTWSEPDTSPPPPPGVSHTFRAAFPDMMLRALDFYSTNTGSIVWDCYNGYFMEGCLSATTDGAAMGVSSTSGGAKGRIW